MSFALATLPPERIGASQRIGNRHNRFTAIRLAMAGEAHVITRASPARTKFRDVT
jgi:hypothetical protein